MKPQLANDIIACLPSGHTPFLYSRDDYAFHLLGRALKNKELSIHTLKKSNYSPLLSKPKVKSFLALSGSQTLSADHLHYGMGGSDATKFNLSLGTWGAEKHDHAGWTQTTRGKANLVLQLNWGIQGVSKLEQAYRSNIGHVHYGGHYHPISKQQNTLSWARIDCDLNTGEALIEEIQSDWIRGFMETESRLTALLKNDEEKIELQDSIKQFLCREHYLWEKVRQYKNLWAETTLIAALRFIHEDLGIEHIFYHSFESGCALKRIAGAQPPRSLYTDLPRKFCMQKSQEIPSFLKQDKYFNKQSKKLNIPVEFFQLPSCLPAPASHIVAGSSSQLTFIESFILFLCEKILRRRSLT